MDPLAESLLAPRRAEHIGRDPKVRSPTLHVVKNHERRPVVASCVRLKHALAILDPMDAEDHLS